MAEQPRDYYDPEFGRFVTEHRGIEPGAELWDRQLPIMRVYGFVVLGLAAVFGLPRLGGDAPRTGVTALALAALAVAFAIMWIRRPIWEYSVRTLVLHGAFQLGLYALLVGLEPGFAVIALIVYPQIVFSLQTRWSVLGTFFVGIYTGLSIVWHSPGDPAGALPWLFYNVLIAAIVVAIGVWMRLTIAQSMERRALIAELIAARRDLAAATREAAIAEERARLAREIHDTLAQGFASVVTNLEAAEAYLGADDARVREGFDAAEQVARASLAEARTLVWALRPETIASAGLPAAIERVASAGGSAGRPLVEVEISGTPRPLHPEVEVTLLRAAQEALTNARRHAGATHVTVTLTYFRDQVTLDVADDGRGFDPETVAGSGGMGLLGMRERAEKLGGSVEIESAPGEGATIALTLPAIEPPTAGSQPEAAAPPATPPAHAAAAATGVRP